MAASEYTKNVRRKLWLYRIIDWILMFAPVGTYICIALADDKVKAWAKAIMVGCLALALIVIIINTLLQKRLRCTIWLVLIGLTVAIRDYLLPLVIILAVVTVADDLVLTPIIEYYRDKLRASETIDERSQEEISG